MRRECADLCTTTHRHPQPPAQLRRGCGASGRSRGEVHRQGPALTRAEEQPPWCSATVAAARRRARWVNAVSVSRSRIADNVREGSACGRRTTPSVAREGGAVGGANVQAGATLAAVPRLGPRPPGCGWDPGRFFRTKAEAVAPARLELGHVGRCMQAARAGRARTAAVGAQGCTQLPAGASPRPRDCGRDRRDEHRQLAAVPGWGRAGV